MKPQIVTAKATFQLAPGWRKTYRVVSGSVAACKRCGSDPILVETPADPESGPGWQWPWFHLECSNPECGMMALSHCGIANIEKTIKSWF